VKVCIWFPWDPDAKLFKGERVYIDREDPFLGR
jgi:hypothetical protein